MIKAAVVEIKKNKAVVLEENGTFRVLKNKDYEIGQVIYLKDSASALKSGLLRLRNKILIIAGAVGLVGAGGVVSYAMPVSYVYVEEDGVLKEYQANIYNVIISSAAEETDSETDSYNGRDLNTLLKEKESEATEIYVNAPDYVISKVESDVHVISGEERKEFSERSRHSDKKTSGSDQQESKAESSEGQDPSQENDGQKASPDEQNTEAATAADTQAKTDEGQSRTDDGIQKEEDAGKAQSPEGETITELRPEETADSEGAEMQEDAGESKGQEGNSQNAENAGEEAAPAENGMQGPDDSQAGDGQGAGRP